MRERQILRKKNTEHLTRNAIKKYSQTKFQLLINISVCNNRTMVVKLCLNHLSFKRCIQKCTGTVFKKDSQTKFQFRINSCNNTTIAGQVSYSNDLWFKGRIQKCIVPRLIKFHIQTIYDSQDVFKNVLYPVWSSFIFKWFMIQRTYSKMYCTPFDKVSYSNDLWYTGCIQKCIVLCVLILIILS